MASPEVIHEFLQKETGLYRYIHMNNTKGATSISGEICGSTIICLGLTQFPSSESHKKNRAISINRI
jgi:hypothetical protein